MSPTSSSGGPPELPPGSTSDHTYRPDDSLQGIKGAEGLAERELLEEIGRGGRFVMVNYAFSVVVMSFRRTFGLRFLKAGETAAGQAWLGSIITIIFGWWGIPWGPIYSIQSLFHNAMGGQDVTKEILAKIVGEQPATAAMKLRLKPSVGGGIWALRAALLAVPAMFALMIAQIAAASIASEAARKQLPGYAEYKTAADTAKMRSGGNTAQANLAATRLDAVFSKIFSEMKTTKGRSIAAPKIWIHEGKAGVVMMVFVADWRKFSSENKNDLSQLLWSAATDHWIGEKPKKMLLAIRGLSTWDRAYSGAGDELPPSAISGDDAVADECVKWFAE